MKRFLIILVLSVVANQACNAYSLIDRGLDDLYDASEYVIEGDLIGIEGNCRDKCTIYYDIRVSKTVKGALEASVISNVCAFSQLPIGTDYVLFLLDAPAASSNARCRYQIQHDGAFRRLGPRTYRIMSPDSMIMVENDGNLYTTDTVLFRNFPTEFDSRTKED